MYLILNIKNNKNIEIKKEIKLYDTKENKADDNVSVCANKCKNTSAKIKNDDNQEIEISNESVTIGKSENLNKLSDKFGYVMFTVEFENTVYYSHYIDIKVSEEFYNSYVEKMYNYIKESKDLLKCQAQRKILNCFNTSVVEKFEERKTFYEKMIKLYTINYQNFRLKKINRLKKEIEVTDFQNIQNVNNTVIKYIVEHPNYLHISENGILIDDDYYVPEKAGHEKTMFDDNLYENYMVYSFLDVVYIDLGEYINELEKWSDESFGNTDEDGVSVPYRILSERNGGIEEIIKELNQYWKKIADIKMIYKQLFSFADRKYPKINQKTLKLTDKIVKHQHYFIIYKLIGDYFVQPIMDNSNLSNITDLEIFSSSTLYEFYCLCAFLNYFNDNDYDISGAYNYYTIKNSTDIIRLYVQTIIHNKERVGLYRNNTKLYRPNKGFDVKETKKNYYTPDFVFEILRSGTKEYYIFDSKFSNIDTVLRYSLLDVMMKYGVGISAPDGIKRVVGVIYGKFNENQSKIDDDYTFNNLAMTNETFYTALQLSPKYSVEDFWKKFKNVFSNHNLIEQPKN